MTGTYTANGRTYTDTPAGWLRAARDKWDRKLTAKGHKMTWRKVGRVSQNTLDSAHYLGTCRNCRAWIEAGEYWSAQVPEITTGGVFPGMLRRCPGKQGRR
jgi:hypothetical protein